MKRRSLLKSFIMAPVIASLMKDEESHGTYNFFKNSSRLEPCIITEMKYIAPGNVQLKLQEPHKVIQGNGVVFENGNYAICGGKRGDYYAFYYNPHQSIIRACKRGNSIVIFQNAYSEGHAG